MTEFKVGDREFEIRRITNSPYFVTRCGEIISEKTGKVLRGGTSTGYRTAILCWDGQRQIVRHHALVLRWFVGPRPMGMVINHKDGNKQNNNLDNLEYCTPRDNREHAKSHRLYHSGSRCSWSKLNEEQAMLIRRAHDIGMSLMQLARAFEVSKKAINQVIQNKAWTRFVEAKEKK